MADKSNENSSINHNKLPGSISYVRPADRTPEKDFNKLKHEDKKRICARRTMIVRVRDKINRLEDEVDERSKEVESERKQRQQLESQLQGHLKDMYENPEVNQELRNRLPRANKSDPFKTEEHSETDLSSIEEQIVEGEDGSLSEPKLTIGDRLNDQEGEIAPNTVQNNMTLPTSSTPKAKRNINFDDNGKHNSSMKTSNITQTPLDLMDRSPLKLNQSQIGPAHGYYGHAFGANPYLSFNGNLSHTHPHPMFNSTSHLTPAMHRPMSTPMFRSTGQDLLVPQAQLSQASSVPSLSAASPTGASFREPAPVTIATSTTTATAEGATADTKVLGATSEPVSDSGFASAPHSFLSQPPSFLHNSVLPNVSPLQRLGDSSYQGLDKDRQIARLLKEIEDQRAIHRKREAELESKSRELEVLRLTQRMQELEGRAGTSEVNKAAGIVEEVYEAQRKRDDATRGRMDVANQERDEILARLRQLEQRMDVHSSHLSPSDDDLHLDVECLENEDLHYFLSRMDSPSPSEHDMNSLVRKVEEVRHKQREVTHEELQVVMEQRDVALARCRKLESELLRYQKHSEADGGMDGNIKAKLSTLQQERDIAVAKSKQLDNQVQTLRLYYSLHNSLSSEVPIREQTDNAAASAPAPASVEEELASAQTQLQHSQKENGRLVGQLRTVTIEKKQLEEALEKARQDKDRLQRLAGVLKKKLDGQPPQDNQDTH